jgi:hypothetical protein
MYPLMVCKAFSVRHHTRLGPTYSIIPEGNDEPQSTYVVEHSPPMVIDAAVEDVNSVRRRHGRRSGEFRGDGFGPHSENRTTRPQPVSHHLEKLDERAGETYQPPVALPVTCLVPDLVSAGSEYDQSKIVLSISH